jgi:radical SAM-linked protein
MRPPVPRMPEGPPPEPAVQRLRLRFAKRGRLRFTSHRDFQRAFERALRRNAVPMAYSAGFNPHPKISFAGAAPTGAASEAEYLEISLTRRRDPELLRQHLDNALPPGLDVLEIVEAGPGALADRLEASIWRIELSRVNSEEARDAVRGFLSAERVEVSRTTKKGPRVFDTRAAVLSLTVTSDQFPVGGEENLMVRVSQGGPDTYAILRLVVRHTTPAVRPDDVLVGLRSQAHLAPLSSSRVTRLAQGLLDEENGTVADPLAADRNVVGS